MRKELAEDVVASQNVDLVGQEELLWRRVEDRLPSCDTSIVDLFLQSVSTPQHKIVDGNEQ
jgi:hypothetical protein